MLFIGAAIGAVVQLGTSIFGAIQANKAKKAQIAMAEQQMEKANALREQAEADKVDYKTPQELEDNIADAKAALGEGDAVVDAAVTRADQTVANVGAQAERAATSSGSLLSTVQSANVAAGESVVDAEAGAEERKAQKRRELARAREGVVASRDKEYDVNVAQPYFQAISDSRQLEDAATTNQQGAINTGAQNAANMTKAAGKAGGLLAQVDFKSIFGKKNQGEVEGQMSSINRG
jgi:hypothetical protein